MERSPLTSTSDRGPGHMTPEPEPVAPGRAPPAGRPGGRRGVPSFSQLGHLLAVLAVFALLGGAVWWFGPRPAADPYPGGRAAARAGDYDQALHAARLLEATGRADDAALIRGESLLNQGQAREALEVVSRVPESSPRRIDA